MFKAEDFKIGFESLLEFFYPSLCLVCDSYIDRSNDLICSDCWEKIDYLDHLFCGNCSQVLPKNHKCLNCGDNVLPVIGLGYYSDILGEIVRQYKHHGFSKLGAVLADKLIENHLNLFSRINVDLMIPIPLYSYREKTRGFNQAAVLADTLSRRLGIPYNKTMLKKIKNTKDQKFCRIDEREKNIEGAYRFFGDNLKGKKILLIDDVITTGATLREARKILTMAGGIVPLAVVVAVAGVLK